MELKDPCSCCVATLDGGWVHHLLVHGQQAMSPVDQAVGPTPTHIMLYSNSTVDYGDLCRIRKLYDLDFCGLGVLIQGAALHAGRWRLHAVQLYLGLHNETISVG